MRSSNWALRLSVLLLLLACGIECAKNRHFKHSHKKDDQQQNDDEDRREDNNSPQTYGDDGQIAPKFGQSGREYRFRFDSQTASGYASWISTQRAMSRFQALVSVKFLSDKEAEMRISECLAGQLNSKPVIDSWDPARIQPVAAFESNNKFQHEEMERPIRFSYEQGAINKIRFSPEEPAWSKNVKKAVLNMMQLQLAKDVVQQKRNPVEKIIERELRQQTNTVGGKPQQQQQGQREEGVFSTELEKSFSLSEMTIEGDCECQYTMVPINSGELLNVTKSVNFDRCRLLADVAFGMQADEEAKQRGGQEEERNMNSEYKHDWLANIGLSEMQQAEAQMRNRSGSPTIAKQFLDRSTTIRYVLSNQQQQQKKQSNGEEKPGLDAYGIQHVELLSQYVLKSSEAESSQAMQTVATAHLRFLGSRKGDTGAKKVENESLESEGESLLYNAEMELQEKCFYMFGDDATDERRCIGQQQQQQQSGAAAGTPYPLNYPNSEAKVGRAVQMLRMVVQEQQQQQQGIAQEEERKQAMDTAENVDELIQIVRFCSEKELKKIQDKLEDGTNANSVRARQFFADALAAAGTRNSLKVLLQRIESGAEFADLRSAQLLKIFSRGSGLPAPSDKIADLVLALCKSGKVQKSAILKQACWLSFGAIVGELTQQQRIVRFSPVRTPTSNFEFCPDHKMELYTKALVEQFNNADDLLEKVVALKAIGNAALDSVPQELVDYIKTANPKSKQREAIRTNAMEALRRIPSQKVEQLLAPVYLNQEEQPMTRIIALSVLVQSQLSPSAPILDQIGFQITREKCPQVLSYSHSTLQAMANSPAKRHQKIAQHIKTALNLAGVDENALKEKCTDAASRFDRSAAFYSQKEETGAIVEFANVFTGKSATVPAHSFMSFSSLINGQMSEEKLKLTLCQGNVERFFQQILKMNGEESGQEDEDEKSQEEKKNKAQQSSSSYFSSAKEQLKSIWSQLKGITGAGGQQQTDEYLEKLPFVVASLRVNNIDTIVLPIVGAAQPGQQKSPLESLKQMLTMAGARSASEYANGEEKPAVDVNGILFYQGRSARIPTSTGQQLNIQLKSTVFGQIRADARQLGRTQLSLEFRPAFSYAVVQKMKTWSSPMHASGVKRVTAVEVTIPLAAQITVQPQQQQVKFAFRVPQSATRLFAMHTMPSTFVSDKVQQLQRNSNGDEKASSASPHHYGERVRSLENQQLRGHRINVDKTVYQVVGLPIHVQGQMHRPRCLNELKEWAKVVLASENHYRVDFEPKAGQSPREVAITFSWDFFNLHPNTPAQSMRPKLREFLQNLEQQSAEQNGNEKQSSFESFAEQGQDNAVPQKSRLDHALQVLQKYGQQKAYKHTLKWALETVGGEQNKRADVLVESVCNALFTTCDSRVQLKCSREGQNVPVEWQADAQMHTIFPLTAIDLDHMQMLGGKPTGGQAAELQGGEDNNNNEQQKHFKLFMYKAEFEWGPGQQQGEKQFIKLNMKGEPSMEMMRLFRAFIQANKEATTSASAGQQQSRLLPRNAGRPFINTYQIAVDYKLQPEALNFYHQFLALAKAQTFANTDSQFLNNNNGKQKPRGEGQVRASISIDPITQKHMNVSIQTNSQQVNFRQLELSHPFRPLPMVRIAPSVRQSHSLQQMLQQSVGHRLRSRAECRMDTRREQMQTFDGVQTAAPISKCWTVLAKSCNHQQQQQQTDEIPEFAVLIKSITGSQQKKLKVITPEMGVLVIEPKAEQSSQEESGDGFEKKMQVRLNGQAPLTSEMAQSQIPDGIEFAQPTNSGSGKETVIIESAQGHFRVRFNGQTVRINLQGMDYQNAQCGLCGNWDGEAGNDMQKMPHGGEAQNAQQYQRSFVIEDEQGQDGACTESALDQFYAQQAFKFEEERLGGGQQQKNQQRAQQQETINTEQQQGQGIQRNKNVQQQEDEDEEADGMEIAPQQQTKILEYAHQLCFSLRPVKGCPVGSFASTADSTEKSGASVNLKQQKVPFTCFDRSSLEAKRLKQQARHGQSIQLADYPASFQEMVVIPERCIKY